MKRILRAAFPLLYGMQFADEGAGSGADDKGTGAGKTPAAGDAGAGTEKKPETVTVSKADWDRLNGATGNLQQKLKQFEDAERARQEEEQKKAGKYEELLKARETELNDAKPYRDKYVKRVQAEHERRMKLTEKCDEKVRGQFRVPKDGKDLSLDDMEFNLSKLDEYEGLGLLKPVDKKEEDRVVVPKTVTPEQAPEGAAQRFNPWSR